MARLLLADDPQDANALLVLASALEGQGRHAECLQIAREATRLEPEHRDAWLAVANAACDLDDPQTAREAAQQALRLDSHHWLCHYTMGRALLTGRRPRTRDALRFANEAARLQPWSADAHNLAGICCAGLGLTKEARRAYAEALRLDPHNSAAMNNFGIQSLGGGHLLNASSILTAAAGTDPQSGVIQHNLDIVLLQLLLRLCLLAAAGCLIESALLAAEIGRWFRAPAALVTISIGIWMAHRILRELPRGSMRWAARVGWRGLAKFVLLGLVLPTGLVCLLTLGFVDIDLGPRTSNGLSGVLSPASFIVLGLVLGGRYWARRRLGQGT